jgi:formate dehydrogenase gamma subunit
MHYVRHRTGFEKASVFMKRRVSVRAVLLFLILIACQLSRTGVADTQPGLDAQPAPKPEANSEESKRPTLDCSGCHGAGKTLPYLGQEFFHSEAHKAYDHGFHARGIQQGRKAAGCLDCHSERGDMTTILPARDPKSTINRANIAKTCGSCHSDKMAMDGTGISNRPFLSYQESVHASAILHGNTKAAVCTDCHNSHDIMPASDAGSTIFKANISKTCGQCHASIANEYNGSVHGEAVARGVSRSPVCTDCHGIHNIKPRVDPTTSATSQALATGSCAQCHEGVALSQEFGVPSGRMSSYQDSYHGLASRLGSTMVANCASCHGVHNILPSSDSRSTISRANLINTCGQCHPGASENFITGKIHLTPAATGSRSSKDIGVSANAWVRSVYLWLITIVIGGMVLHNLLVWRKKAAALRRQAYRPILRMSSRQRFQHWMLLISFLVLVLTGFALKYPDSWLAAILGGNEAFRRVTHRIAGVLMLATGFFHIYYVLFNAEGRRAFRDMLPCRKDIADLVQALRYYATGASSRPRFDRFNYGEKAEYWAVLWGTIIMGITGLMVWFKVAVFGFLPKWVIDVALTIHFYEAILATLAILVWHFYSVIFDPDVYPLNWAVLDGRVSREYYKEEHELDYERIMSALPDPEPETNTDVRAAPSGEELSGKAPV